LEIAILGEIPPLLIDEEHVISLVFDIMVITDVIVEIKCILVIPLKT